MDWQEHAERQVGATGIDDVRRMLSDARADDRSRSRARTFVGWGTLVAVAVVVASAAVIPFLGDEMSRLGAPRTYGVELSYQF